MKILVTGSRGFIGAAIERRLGAEGHTVVGAVRRRDLAAHEVFVDFAESGPIRGLPDDIEVVVHSAAHVGGTRFSRAVMAVNAGGTARLVAWARGAGVRHFVQISSIGAYGAQCVGEDRDEDTPLCWSPVMPAYLRSKAQAERYVVAGGVPYTILRLPAVFGAGDAVVTPAVVPELLQGGLPRVSRRDPRVSTLWVRNAAEVVAAVVRRGPLQTALKFDRRRDAVERVHGRVRRGAGAAADVERARDAHAGDALRGQRLSVPGDDRALRGALPERPAAGDVPGGRDGRLARRRARGGGGVPRGDLRDVGEPRRPARP
jgi:nucleoside-diphosphate-sugar epimerase